MAKKFVIVLGLLGCISFPYCSGMIVLPVSGMVSDDRTLLPIENAEVLIGVRTPLFSLDGERSQPFFTLQTMTGKDGTYRTPWTFQGFVEWRMTFRRVYKVNAMKEGYAVGGGWSMEHYTGVTYRDSPFEKWLRHNPKLESEVQFEGTREAIREALNIPTMVFPIGQSPDNIDSLSKEKRRKGYVDDILRSLLFVGYMMENYGAARPIDIENMKRHCRNILHVYESYESHEPEVRQDIMDFLDGNYEGRDVSSLAAVLAEPARSCLLIADGKILSANDR